MTENPAEKTAEERGRPAKENLTNEKYMQSGIKNPRRSGVVRPGMLPFAVGLCRILEDQIVQIRNALIRHAASSFPINFFIIIKRFNHFCKSRKVTFL